MSETTTVLFTCDLCGHSSSDQNKVRSKWVRLTLEDPMRDNEFFGKDVCCECIEKIRVQSS